MNPSSFVSLHKATATTTMIARNQYSHLSQCCWIVVLCLLSWTIGFGFLVLCVSLVPLDGATRISSSKVIDHNATLLMNKTNHPEETHKSDEMRSNGTNPHFWTKDDHRRRLIINGKDTSPGEYPYFSLLPNPGCGGTLIAPDIVLTAGHCRMKDVSSYGKVLVGHYTDYGGRHSDAIAVSKQRLHPDYNDEVCCGYAGHNGPAFYGVYNDFLLLKLKSSSSQQTIRLNQVDSKPGHNRDLHVIGVGDTDPDPYSYRSPPVLQEVTVNYMSNDKCADSSIYPSSLLDDSSFCAMDHNEDACGGDSGGPLIQRTSSNRDDLQVGLVSWGYGCADQPGVYGRISHAYDWIRDSVCDMSSSPPARFQCPGAPTKKPTATPSKRPTVKPTPTPTELPTQGPTSNPTPLESTQPSLSMQPTAAPTTLAPTPLPTTTPSVSPTDVPTQVATANPTPLGSAQPTVSAQPTAGPTTLGPTPSPTLTSSETSTQFPSSVPTHLPTPWGSAQPSLSMQPTIGTTPPTEMTTSNRPSETLSEAPSKIPSNKPSKTPSKVPTVFPTTAMPSGVPTMQETLSPESVSFSLIPTVGPDSIDDATANSGLQDADTKLPVEETRLEALFNGIPANEQDEAGKQLSPEESPEVGTVTESDPSSAEDSTSTLSGSPTIHRSVLPAGLHCAIASASSAVCCSSLSSGDEDEEGSSQHQECVPSKTGRTFRNGLGGCAPLPWILDNDPSNFDTKRCPTIVAIREQLAAQKSCASVVDRTDCCRYFDNRADGSSYDGQPCVPSRNKSGFPGEGFGFCEPANLVAEHFPEEAMECSGDSGESLAAVRDTTDPDQQQQLDNNTTNSSSSNPVLYTMLVLTMFLLMALAFFVHDSWRERHQINKVPTDMVPPTAPTISGHSCTSIGDPYDISDHFTTSPQPAPLVEPFPSEATSVPKEWVVINSPLVTVATAHTSRADVNVKSGGNDSSVCQSLLSTHL